jgi:futalosine hydrolase
MKILIVTATRTELSGLCSNVALPEGDFIQTEAFDVLVTGVGMTATAFALGKHLSDAYNLVVNLGIAGCYEWKYPLGCVLNVTHDTFSELGAEDRDEFLTIETLGFGKSIYTAKNELSSAHVTSLPMVRGITVNKVHGNKKSIRAIEKRLHPVTESMEGAAVFYCCEQLDIPCIQIRSISNYVEERNRESWKIGLAVKNLNDWAVKFLTSR